MESRVTKTIFHHSITAKREEKINKLKNREIKRKNDLRSAMGRETVNASVTR